jgi:hypothetical protein
VTAIASDKIEQMLQQKQVTNDWSGDDHSNFDAPIPAKVACRIV